MPCIAAGSPHEHDHASVEMTCGDDAFLAVICPIIDPVVGSAAKNLVGPCEIETRSNSVLARFAGSNEIFINVYTKTPFRKFDYG